MKLSKSNIILSFIGYILDKFIYIWLFYLSATQLISSHYIEGSLLLIAAVFYQRAWIVEFEKYQEECDEKRKIKINS